MRLMFYVQNYLEMDKIDRLLEAMEHPDSYSENDVEAMLADPEVREVYDLLDKTSATFRPMPDPDVEAEWTAFKRSRNRRGLTCWVSRNVAASVAIGLASLATLAAVVVAGVGHVFDKRVDGPSVETVVADEECVIPDDVAVAAADTTVLAPEIIIFENDSLEEIVSRVAGYHGYEVEFSADAPRGLRLHFRWNQAHPLDEVVESLNNFERIHITVKGRTIKID